MCKKNNLSDLHITELAGLSSTCRHSPLQRYFRLDQIIFSCEKQNTPSLPPLMLVSIITPVSATRFEPSKKRALVPTQSVTICSVHIVCLSALDVSDCWCVSGCTWYIQPAVCAEGTSDRRPCPSSQHSWDPSTGDGPDLRCLLYARGSSSDTPQDQS